MSVPDLGTTTDLRFASACFSLGIARLVGYPRCGLPESYEPLGRLRLATVPGSVLWGLVEDSLSAEERWFEPYAPR